ncbi:S-formylglutathione hydrolase [Paraburkholderia sp.]|uniref:S-formylglutathione hydrolase n=1 Tax=Paraburkholderia sp. TaxID=1926495 RepID=UPI003C7ADD9C
MTIETRSEYACFGGRMGYYSHASKLTGTTMNFAVFVPSQALTGPVPALYYLAGLTCTEETFMIKAGAQRLAAKYGLMLVSCDTSPRGLDIPGDSNSWDFGVGAEFYDDAVREPWGGNYRMGSYVNLELPEVVEAHFPASRERRGIFGHSMGGHGALITALRHRGRWHSVSAFAPISNPCEAPWGRKAFSNYLGEDSSGWLDSDASILMSRGVYPGKILVDQGEADEYLADQLRPEALARAAEISGQNLQLRVHPGYDHSYWFIQTFMANHVAHHAEQLLP